MNSHKIAHFKEHIGDGNAVWIYEAVFWQGTLHIVYKDLWGTHVQQSTMENSSKQKVM